MNVGKADVANIGTKEIRKRRAIGVTMLALGVVVAVVLVHANVSRGWYASLFLPFWIGTLALFQARKKT